jgi:hypothetical protein
MRAPMIAVGLVLARDAPPGGLARSFPASKGASAGIQIDPWRSLLLSMRLDTLVALPSPRHRAAASA